MSVEQGVRLHSMCSNKRCEILHKPEVQKQYLLNKIKVIKGESRRGVPAKFNKCVNAHSVSEEIETMQNMGRWVKITRVFKKNTKKW